MIDKTKPYLCYVSDEGMIYQQGGKLFGGNFQEISFENLPDIFKHAFKNKPVEQMSEGMEEVKSKTPHFRKIRKDREPGQFPCNCGKVFGNLQGLEYHKKRWCKFQSVTKSDKGEGEE